MRDRVRIDFACNDPDNGDFAGKVWQAAITVPSKHGPSEQIELETKSGADRRFTILRTPDDVKHEGEIRMHRVRIPFETRIYWIGNWCWDGFWLNRADAKRLLSAMRKNGWQCTCGPVRWYDWFNAATSTPRSTGGEG